MTPMDQVKALNTDSQTDRSVYALLFMYYTFSYFVTRYTGRNFLLKYIDLSSITVFHCAVGEEFVFRMLPDMIALPFSVRLFISAPLFAVLHMYPIIHAMLKVQDKCTSKIFLWKSHIYLAMNACNFGVNLLLLQHLLFSHSATSWYVFCACLHASSNLYVIHKMKKNSSEQKTI